MRGAQAIRGFCISSVPIADFQIAVDGQIIHKGSLECHPVEDGSPNQHKYVFNVWHDFSDFAFGRYTVELRFVNKKNRAHSRRERVVIAAPLTEAQFPECDGLVSLVGDDPRPADEQINSRLSVVRSPKRGDL